MMDIYLVLQNFMTNDSLSRLLVSLIGVIYKSVQGYAPVSWEHFGWFSKLLT